MELDRYWRERDEAGAENAKPRFVPLEKCTPNIPLVEYERNLRRIVELAWNHGATVWLATSPDAFTTNEFRDREEAYESTASVQLSMLRLGSIKSFRELAEIHARYNDAVRRVGAELGVVVVDVEEAFRVRSADRLFLDSDAVHPPDLGHAIRSGAALCSTRSVWGTLANEGRCRGERAPRAMMQNRSLTARAGGSPDGSSRHMPMALTGPRSTP